MRRVLRPHRCFYFRMVRERFIIKGRSFIPRSGIFIKMTQFYSEDSGLYIIQPRIHTDIIMDVLYRLPVIGDHLYPHGQSVVWGVERPSVTVTSEVFRREKRS